MIHGTATISNLMTKKPLVNYIGHAGCRIWHLFVVINNLILVIGGTGMAFYRMSIYKLAHRISDCKAIRRVILWIEAIVFLVGLANFGYIPFLTNSTHIDDFCRGHTYEMSQQINSISIEKESIALGKEMTKVGLYFSQMIMLLELICYLILFYWKKRDNNMERNKNLAYRRICQNTITLTGQAISFATETIYVVFLISLKIFTDSEYLKHSYIPIYANFIWCVVTMTHIFTSPDMMRSLF